TPELAGFQLSPSTAQFYDGVTKVICAHSKPDDTILVYPHMPMLYGLANRRPATFSYMHWLDVCPDHIAEQDAAAILEHPPAVIVYMEISPAVFAELEKDFRGGKPSGQRKLVAAVESLVQDYRLVATYTAPGENLPIKVWVR